VDLGCLLCFSERDGRFGWQLSREKLPGGRTVDYPEQGICCAPLVEGKRLWIVTSRGEVVCLDTEGFYDRTNDGPYTSEPNEHRDEADIVWIFDMMGTLGVTPHNMTACSVTAAGDLLLVGTSNGADEQHKHVPSPKAPSFIALDKHTGKLVWADNSPGENILDGQWSSPAFAVLGGIPQAIFPGGDGWLYSFRAEPAADGKPELLWKFDCNPKASVWKTDGSGDRSNLIATPVLYQGRVYIATGQDPECGEGQGHLWCIDPTRRGDVSPELVVGRDGKGVTPRRIQAIDPSAGETLVPNPNSAAVWHYTGLDAKGDGKPDFQHTMHRSLSAAAIKDDLLVIADLAGLVHCLDAKTGKPHWTYDLLSQIWGSPCLVEGKIYLGDQDGDVAVFELSSKLKLLAKNAVGDAVYSTPTVVGDVLYISTSTHLIAVGGDRSTESK
jgi:outer membrane protein assembly factor BamB